LTTFYIYIVLTASVVLSFWSSLVEATYLTLKPTSLAPMLRQGNKKAEKVLHIVSEKAKLVSVTTFTDTVANIAIASSTGLILSEIFGIVGWLYDTIMISLVIMVFLYLFPKTLGIEDSLRLAIFLSSSTLLVIKVLSPVAIPLTSIARKLSLTILRERRYSQSTLVSEFEDMLVVLERGGHIEPDLARILRTALSSSKTNAGDICTPINQIVSIPKDAKIIEAIKTMAISKHPRLPVFDSSRREWIGAITFRSLMNAIASGNLDQTISDYVIQPAKVNVDDSVASVTQKMEEADSTIAFVYDNDQKIIGLVTLSDIIENVIGIKV